MNTPVGPADFCGPWPQCLECLRAFLSVSAAARDKLLHAATPIRGQSTAALFALLQSALHRPLLQVIHLDALILTQHRWMKKLVCADLDTSHLLEAGGFAVQERLAAEAVLAAFCIDNPAGQAQLASTLAPSSKSGVAAFNTAIGCVHAMLSLCPSSPPLLLALSSTLVAHWVAGPSFGAELLSALAQGDPASTGTARTAAAARILAHLLADCTPAKGHALTAQTPAGQHQNNGGTAPAPLLSACCLQAAAAHAAGPLAAPAAAALHSLLVVWCHSCEPAAAALAAQAAHLQLLSDLVASRSVLGAKVWCAACSMSARLCWVASGGTA